MSAKWIIAALWLAVFAPAPAAADTLGAGDRQAIRSIIQSQLGAFRRDDGHEAFSYASPGIRPAESESNVYRRCLPFAWAVLRSNRLEIRLHNFNQAPKVVKFSF